MATRRVTIIDPSGSKKTQVELPDHVPVERLVNALAPKMNLPQLDQGGQPISYRLTATRDNEEQVLNPEQTLADGGIQDDDALRLYANMQGGRWPREAAHA